MPTTHFILQGKGGVGKSLVASLLAQYLRHKEQAVRCFDTDPINATLAGYADLHVDPIEIMQGSDIDPRRFDGLMDRLLHLPKGRTRTLFLVLCMLAVPAVAWVPCF
ncbi:nucleotide-binding protein [Megalodesulfovibrio paquesii]